MNKQTLILSILICLQLSSCSQLSKISPVTTTTRLVPIDTPTHEILSKNTPSSISEKFPTEIVSEAVLQKENNNQSTTSQNKLPPYILQPGTPSTSVNFLHPEKGCHWLGVVGQAFNNNNQPVIGLIVEVDGVLEGRTILMLGLSGGSPDVGRGGYELVLSDHTIESRGTLWIQLFDVSGTPQSQKIYFDTFQDCNRNLIMVNFVELGTRVVPMFYVPLIKK
jgi:hypothetical protein